MLGPEGSFFAGNTEVGLVLTMTLPILLFLRRQATQWWLRQLVLATFGFSIVAILITHSRGGLLGLVAVLALLFLRSKSKLRRSPNASSKALPIIGLLSHNVFSIPMRSEAQATNAETDTEK